MRSPLLVESRTVDVEDGARKFRILAAIRSVTVRPHINKDDGLTIHFYDVNVFHISTVGFEPYEESATMAVE